MRNTYQFVIKILLPLMLGVAGGCSSNPPASVANENLDTHSGIIINGLAEPVVFHHEAPRLAANVRDYLYVGPVEMNRLGKRSYYLWIAEWSTIDRLSAADSPNGGAQDIVVILDGVPMELRDGSALDNQYGDFQNPYGLPVDSARQVYMRVSRAQLTRMAAAGNVVIRVNREGDTRLYELWNGNIASFASIGKDPEVVSRQPLVKISD